jgi:hypothetical protein
MKAFVDVYLCNEHRLKAIEEYGLQPDYFMYPDEIKDKWIREKTKAELDRHVCSVQGCSKNPIVSDYLTFRIRDWN